MERFTGSLKKLSVETGKSFLFLLFQFTLSLWELMCECWSEKPRARLSALNVKNRLCAMNPSGKLAMDDLNYFVTKFECISKS